jgi:NAD(P)-dependent dehydrogenase (short-subunit alcohol dehydrogenase family)
MAFPDVSGRSLATLLRLDDRVAVVTGGGRGIGLATAHRLAEAGALVAVADVHGDAARAAAEDVAAGNGARAIGVGMDVTDTASVASAATRIVGELGRIDVWVNNAGVYPAARLLDMGDDDWDHVLEVNLRGTFLCAREAARRMVEGGRGGVIVNVASTSGLRTSRGGRGHYVASKHGVVGLTKALAAEVGEHGIRVLAVAPTSVDTPGVREQLAGADAERIQQIREGAAALPSGRGCVADDVARVIMFCASDLATMMTGSTVLVDGGADAIAYP